MTGHVIVESNRITQLLPLDIQKAFNFVRHEGLIVKLYEIETPIIIKLIGK